MTAAIIDLTSRLKSQDYRVLMNDNDVVPVPAHVSAALAADVLALPVEMLKWVSLVGPRIAALDDDTRAKVLAEMGNIAAGGHTIGVNVDVADNVVQVTTTEGGDVNLS